MSLNEADTCRIFVTPAIKQAGWNDFDIREQHTFTDGRVIPLSKKHAKRGEPKRADYLLRYSDDIALAVVEAKAEEYAAGTGVQQAREYAEILKLKFAYATNGHEIIEIDLTTGKEQFVDCFPSKQELWERLKWHEQLDDLTADKWATPAYDLIGRKLRYYQEIAVNLAVKAVLQGQERILLTMATGTGKTVTAFQICWKLWNSKWNRVGKPNTKPRILFLADRNILVDDPKDKTFIPFGDARWKIESGKDITRGREMYFAIYQALADRDGKPGIYTQYPQDYFDLIVVDECHRGSARDDSNWRDILDYFAPAYKLGMTATPLRDDNRDTYEYFGNPIYEYSLKQGIEDGFLAPYRVHRVLTNVDMEGWRPTAGERDKYGREIPDKQYTTTDFERLIVLRARTEAIATHLMNYMQETDEFAKTIVFCVDQDHADEMRRAINNLRSEQASHYTDYAVRIVSDEGNIGRGFLSKFQDPENVTPVIVTSSKMLTTGVDVPTCQNIVIATVVGSMTEFKQIIGRGTRLRTDYGKEQFTILDYTGSATTHFADPAFDGTPAQVVEEQISAHGERLSIETETAEEHDHTPDFRDDPAQEPRKFYVDNGSVEIVYHVVRELDPDGHVLRTVEFTDYTADKVRTLYHNAAEIQQHWADPRLRSEIISQLSSRGIDFEQLAGVTGQVDADPFDLLCYVAFNSPLRTRRERAERLRREELAFFERYSPEARAILNALLDKYTENIMPQFELGKVLKLEPFASYGTILQISNYFGGVDDFRNAVNELQRRLYSA